MQRQTLTQKSSRLQLARYKRILRKHLPELREHYKVVSLGMFGSYVRGEARPRSDLDILVEFEQSPDLFRFMDLEEYLAKKVGVKVDLVPRRALKGEIGERILSEVVLI